MRKFRGWNCGIYYHPPNLDFEENQVVCLIARFSEQDHKSCSCKSGSLLSLINQANQAPLPSLINPAHANQAPHASLINPAQANQANLSAWSILLRQIRQSGKRRKFMRSLSAAISLFLLWQFVYRHISHTVLSKSTIASLKVLTYNCFQAHIGWGDCQQLISVSITWYWTRWR